MTAIVGDPLYQNIPVESIPVSPHRYTWIVDDSWRDIEPLREWLKNVPYHEGEVVWVALGEVAVRALIFRVTFERDRYGDRREVYKVQPETKKGTFANRWRKAYPGTVQRGYKLAGLAPDIPENN